MRLTPFDTAKAAWGEAMPDWIRVLAIACTESSQARVAAKLGRTAAMISQLLNAKYPASTDHIEERIRGLFLDGKVHCPAEGALPVNECQDWRIKAKDYQPGNPKRIRMFRACNHCPRFTEISE